MIALNLRLVRPLSRSLPNYKSRLDNQQGIPKQVAHHHVLLYAQTRGSALLFLDYNAEEQQEGDGEGESR